MLQSTFLVYDDNQSIHPFSVPTWSLDEGRWTPWTSCQFTAVPHRETDSPYYKRPHTLGVPRWPRMFLDCDGSPGKSPRRHRQNAKTPHRPGNKPTSWSRLTAAPCSSKKATSLKMIASHNALLIPHWDSRRLAHTCQSAANL